METRVVIMMICMSIKEPDSFLGDSQRAAEALGAPVVENSEVIYIHWPALEQPAVMAFLPPPPTPNVVGQTRYVCLFVRVCVFVCVCMLLMALMQSVRDK